MDWSRAFPTKLHLRLAQRRLIRIYDVCHEDALKPWLRDTEWTADFDQSK